MRAASLSAGTARATTIFDLASLRQVTDAAERVLGVRRESTRVLSREVPAEHWGVAGEPIDDPHSGDGHDS
jgi:4-oxalocrotonate tautomerase